MAARLSSFWMLLLLLWVVGILLASAADDLPPGVPNPIGPDGKYTGAMMFTTKAYRNEAFRLVLQEANRVATELRLPEKLPITETDLASRFISPFGYARAKQAIGNITTRNYTYYISQGNKFSYLEGAHQDEDCRRYQRRYTWPVSLMDTNEAYQLATRWLAAAGMDVGALNRDYAVAAGPDSGYIQAPRGKFVPVYYVSWGRGKNRPGDVASVRVFTPTKTLMQLRVEDPKYILRPPLVFTNLAYLLSQTNAPPSPSTPAPAGPGSP